MKRNYMTGLISAGMIVLPVLFVAALAYKHFSSSTVVDRRPAGQIVSVEIIPGSFGSPARMVIACENAVATLKLYRDRKTPIVPIGEQAEIVETSNGYFWITWESARLMWLVQ